MRPMNLDRFDKWHKLVETEIQDFMSELPLEISEKLDYSVDSLDVLGDWFLTTYPPYESIKDPSNIIIHNGLMYYLGETLRKNLGGYWNVHFAQIEPNYEYGENPVIEGFLRETALCPWHMIGTMLKRRDRGFFSGLTKGYLDILKLMRKKPSGNQNQVT